MKTDEFIQLIEYFQKFKIQKVSDGEKFIKYGVLPQFAEKLLFEKLIIFRYLRLHSCRNAI